MTNFTFKAYEKIPQNINKGLTETDYRKFKKNSWIVTEKIHGANFSITINEKHIEFAKRKSFLKAHDDFFGYQLGISKLKAKFFEVFKEVCKVFLQTTQITIYGELFGGSYPHPDVAPTPGVQPIQTGVYYTPGVEFCAFDIAIVHQEERIYLDYSLALEILDACKIFCAKPLFCGSYEQALAYPIEFDSTIPSLLGLPALAHPNKAEGVVIKPSKNILVGTDKVRPILKKKISEFAEDKKFHGAQKWSYDVKNNVSGKPSLKSCALALVNKNRLNNVLSKFGRINKKNRKQVKKIKRLFLEDVIEELQEEYKLSETQRNELNKEVRKEIEKVIEAFLKSI